MGEIGSTIRRSCNIPPCFTRLHATCLLLQINWDKYCACQYYYHLVLFFQALWFVSLRIWASIYQYFAMQNQYYISKYVLNIYYIGVIIIQSWQTYFWFKRRKYNIAEHMWTTPRKTCASIPNYFKNNTVICTYIQEHMAIAGCSWHMN